MNNDWQIKRRKTICFLTDYLDVGGVENVLIDAIKCLQDDYEITIIALNGVSDYVCSKLSSNIKVYANTIKRSSNMKDFCLLSIPFLGGLIFKKYIPGEYDYMILLRSGCMMAAYSKKAEKTVFWTHGEKDIMYAEKSISFFRKINKLRLKMGYHKMDATWAVSQHITDKLKEAFGVLNVYTLENPLNCSEIKEKALAFKTDVFEPSCYNFVMVGRLSPEKGHIRALQAIDKLKDQFQCKLVIVGEGIERDSLEKYVVEAGLSNIVTFVGHSSNPYPFIKSADALILPSISESFGLVLLEAMLLRVPVVSTATTGGISLTKNGKYGLLVDNSKEGVYKGMLKAVSEPEMLKKYLDDAERMAQQHDLSNYKKKINDLIRIV